METKAKVRWDILFSILLCMIFSFGLNHFIVMCDVENRNTFLECGIRGLVLRLWADNGLVLAINYVAYACIFGLFIWGYNRISKKVSDYIYTYRYLIAVLIFGLYVSLELSGSSIAWWQNVIGGNENGIMFGMYRGMKGDDFAVWTPFAMSQYYNRTGAFEQFSDIIRGLETDVSIVYGVPTYSLSTFFRPAYWGYLFLSPEKGFSFMWIFRQMAAFFGTFELVYILTNKDRHWALAGALLVSFAPLFQWWFNVASQADVVTYGQIIVVLFYYYFFTDKIWKKIVYAFGTFLFSGAYILIFYPAGQIPVFYVIIVVAIALIVCERKKIEFRPKRDVTIIALTLIALFLCMGIIFINSQDTINAVLNSAYPGKRISTGGGGCAELFRYPIEIWETMNGNDNVFKVNYNVTFVDFFPLGIILGLYILFIENKKDAVIISLVALQSLLTIYLIYGISEIVARITFLSYSTTIAVVWAIGLINIYLLLRAVALMKRRVRTSFVIPFSFIVSLVISIYCFKYYSSLATKLLFVISFVVLWLGVSFICVGIQTVYKKLFVMLSFIIALFGGGFVNPVQKGLDEIYSSELVESIEQISEVDDGLWLVEGSYPLINLPLFVGAPTINSTNVYPALERWKILDPDGKYEEVYNRYAHILINLGSESTTFELIQADLFTLNLTYEDMKKLEVKYLLTNKEYSNVESDIEFELLNNVNGYRMYCVTY